MSRRLASLAVAAGVIAAGGAAGASWTSTAPDAAPVTMKPVASEPAPGPHGIIDVESVMEDVDCDMAQLTGPAATSTNHVTGAEPVALDVLVLVDTAKGQQVAGIKNK